MDIKKIDGTLFKYGYNNSTGTADYSSGGILMNDIAVRQMKTAIYADENILNQIKDIIGYNDPSFGWTGTKADEALEKAVVVLCVCHFVSSLANLNTVMGLSAK